MEMKNYQNDAVKKLLRQSKELFRERGDGKKLVFKSPTGSGKTMMMAEFLKQLSDDRDLPAFSYIWTAPRKLHTQSKTKLTKYYEHSQALKCSDFNDLYAKKINENEILFLNWESIRQEGNVIIRENERDLYLAKILENTKANGCDVILIIDESHYHVSDISQELINDISPKLIVEVSATPIMQNHDEMVRVSLDNVKAEGMIKKSIIINDGIGNALVADNRIISAHANSTDEFVLQQALAKRRELAVAFEQAGVRVNPLLCIQLPDRNTKQYKDTKDDIIRMLSKAGITEENRKLAIYLAEQKENLENISHNEGTSEVLIFKQAIALGWDCPRAHMLLLFRRWHSNVFSVQTLGRIMRMPEPEVGHYQNGLLNSAYVYTNLAEVYIDEDVANGYICMNTANRTSGYAPLKFLSVHRVQQREKTRLSPIFNKIFSQAATEYRLKDKINQRSMRVQTGLISDHVAESVDDITGEHISKNIDVQIKHEQELQNSFDYFVRENLSPFYPEGRSIDRVKGVIYTFFADELNIRYEKGDFSKILSMVLSEANRTHFISVLEQAKSAYKAETDARKKELQETKQWEIPTVMTYSEKYTERPAKKSIMQPFYAAESESNLERQFIDRLEESAKVTWWYKNGVGDSMYFAVPYTENGAEHPFYVDFIVQCTDGTIGLYDTKSGITVDTAKDKSDGLQIYIRSENKKGKKLSGGVITPDNNVWKIYTGPGTKLTSKDLSNWSILEDI